MVRMAVGMWFKLLVLGATALLSVALLTSGPAAAQPTTSPYGPHTTPSTTPATTVPVTPVTTAPSEPSAIAFTGADIALTVTVGALAIGVGGMFVLVSRRRRPRLAVEEVGGK